MKTLIPAYKLALALLCCVFYGPFIFSQSKIYHEVFTSRDGLAIDEIEDLIQDESGYLWISGRNLDNREIIAKPDLISLQRFDGKNFHDIKLSNEIGPLKISEMTSYFDNTIAIYSKDPDQNSVLGSFNITSGKLEVWETKESSLFSNIRLIDGSYYVLNAVGTGVDVYKVNDTQDFDLSFSIENDVKGLINVNRNTTFISYHDYYIFSDDNFPILITDKKGKVIKQFSNKYFNRSRDYISNKFWIEESFIVDDKLYAFMSLDDKLYLFNELTLEFEPTDELSFKGRKYSRIFVDANGNVMISFESNKKLHLLTVNDNNEFVLVYSHDIESEGIIQMWSKNVKDEMYLSIAGELHYYKFPSNQFEKYLVDTEIRAIQHLEGEDYMIATEDKGWYTYNHKDKKIEGFPIFENNRPITLFSSRNILIDKDTLWSHSGGSIIAIHKENGGSRSYRHFPSICLERLNDSILVYGTDTYNLMQFNTINKIHKPLVKTDSLELIDLAIDPEKKWVVCATHKGILTYNIKTQEGTLIQTDLSSNYFLMADYHQNYGFILGTRDGNIVQFDPLNQSTDILYADGLNAGIATVTPYKEDLWINTFNGLVHFNPLSKKTKRYSINDGLSHNEGNRYSVSLTDNGILTGSLRGLNHFIPEELVVEKLEDSLSLLKIRKYDTELDRFVDSFDKSAFAKAKQIVLPVENKLLELDFSLTGLDVLRNESYEYKMNDNEWTSLGELKRLQFLNLAAGNYNLEIRAKDFSGQPIGETLKVDILSEEFFYKKWWFIAIVSFLILTVLLWFVYQERIKGLMQVKFSQDLIQNQEKERSRIAKELHDSIGQQLTLIKKKAQSQKLDGIAQLTNDALEEVRSISRNLYPVIIKQLGLKGAIEHLMLQIDEETDLFVSVIIEGNIDEVFTIEESVNVYRFIQECVSNVLKHAQATTVEVSIEIQLEKIIIDVRDNGKGFNVSEKEDNKSLGLKTLKERIRILNGDLSIQSQLNKGSFTKATIPLKK